MDRSPIEKFIQLARNVPSDTRVPYAFEKRILARLAGPSSLDFWTLWARVLWRAAIPCLALTLAVGVYASFLHEAPPEDLLSAELEAAVFAPVQIEEETW